MPLFKIENNKTKRLHAGSVRYERNLQELFEGNLEDILNVCFLAHEYTTSFGGRIDTLGIDKNGSPVIIEYKKSQNDQVINQGLSYLKWLLDHKKDFEVLCKERHIIIDVDWESPRIVCVAESYNKFDLDTADILPINIELLKYCIYENDILLVEPESFQKIKISLPASMTKKSKKAGEMLQKTYAIDDHLSKAKQPDITNIFLKLREKITSLDKDIREEPKKLYIAYKMSTNFADVEVRSNDLKIFLNIKSGQLNDPSGLARDLTKPKPIGHWGNGDYEVRISKQTDMDKVFDLIVQSYTLNK